MRPLIGITGRQLHLGVLNGTSPKFQHQFVDSYFTAFGQCVAAAGGIPVNLPFAAGAAGVIDRLDGLVVTGGQDVHPERWGGQAPAVPAADPRWDHDAIDTERDDYEATLIEEALSAGVPVLGVCRGHQLLNVVLGGTLVEHLDETLLVHSSPNHAPDDGDLAHVVSFVPGTTAHAVYGPRRVVNSWHHQAVDRLGRDLAVMGRTPDGVVEAIGIPDRPVLGLQWHPEWAGSPDPSFDWLVVEASRRATSRREHGSCVG
ncbi:gamma-glutamyl-gamma-aminobutyrate hydrolase [Nocardioides aromaticivorans]|uniref:Gamma-glutamyl-gamma-aminobutyrate hydrolase n=1 Tax=Nocardioides aromaticivorans TaxID=200618 RepID=A0ABX7PG52_9ACTN|nr:gamma-glutamyl-gamma-aminobutyrate hydrolase family protein [Nocardioides aromaticivorans]QSR24869.1 gamma-glutamyl-gamma-aminobutyrate hydrolase [Nocardioides aromaticivorans]